MRAPPAAFPLRLPLRAGQGGSRAGVGLSFSSLRPGPRDERTDSSWPPRFPQRARPIFCAPPAPGKYFWTSQGSLVFASAVATLRLSNLVWGPFCHKFFASGGPRIAESGGHSRGFFLVTRPLREASQVPRFEDLSFLQLGCPVPKPLHSQK